MKKALEAIFLTAENLWMGYDCAPHWVTVPAFCKQLGHLGHLKEFGLFFAGLFCFCFFQHKSKLTWGSWEALHLQ